MSPTEVTEQAGAIGLTDALAAELIKIRTLPATWVALVTAFVANTALGVLAATDVVRVAGPDAEVPLAQLGTLMLTPVYAFVAVAVFAAGGEYRGGQLRVSLAAVPNRNRLLGAKLIASVAVALLAGIPTLLPGYLIQHAGAMAGGSDLGVGRAVADLLSLLTAYLVLSLIGFGFAFIARTVVTPLAVLLIMPVLVSTTLGALFPDVVRMLPHEATLSFVGMPADPAHALGRAAGLAVTTVWAVLFVVVASTLVTRRDS